MKKPKIKLMRNIWGNYCGYIGTNKVFMSGNTFDAANWLIDNVETNKYTLSDKSYITQADLDKAKKFSNYNNM